VQAPQVTQRRPIEPRETIAYPRSGDQRVHGVVITSATSTDINDVDPAYSTPTVDTSANEPELTSPQAVFPTAIQAVNATATTDGPVDDVVLMPGQFIPDPSGNGKGTQRLFTALGGTVYTSASTDFDAPDITGVTSSVGTGSGAVTVTTDANDVSGGVVLYRDNTSDAWHHAQLAGTGGTLTAALPVAGGATAINDLIVQLVDEAGNVGISTDKGVGYHATVHTTSVGLSTQPERPSSGWYTGPVSVVVTADGPVSVSVDGGPAQLYSGPVTVSGDGTHTVVATAGTITKQLTVNIDTTPPIISGLADGQTLVSGSDVTITCSDPQPGSGLADCTNGGAVDTSSVGTFTRTVTATDNAGNRTSQTLHYSVVAFAGFYAPVNDGVMNTVHAGRTVPIKFNVTTAANSPLTDPSQLQVSTFTISCDASASAVVETTTTAAAGLRWDSSGQQFIDNFKTPSQSGRCIGVSIVYRSATLATAAFRLT